MFPAITITFFMKPCLITRGESIIQLLSHEYPGWWFQPLWKILVSWVYSSQYIYIYIWKNKKCSKPPTAIRLYFINHIINHDTKTISNIHRWFSPRITIYHTKIYRSNLGEPGWSSSLLQPKSCNAVSSHMSNNREKKPGEKKTYRMVEDVHRQCFHMFSL